MHKRIWLVSLLVVLWAGCQEQSDPVGVEAEAHDSHWGYDEADGPGVWADLSPEFSLCREG